MFTLLGKLACRFPWTVVVISLLVLGLSSGYGRDVLSHLTLAPGWEVTGSGSEIVQTRLRDRMGLDETPVIVLFSPKPGGPATVDDPVYRNAVESALGGIAANPDVRAVHSYYYSGDTRFRSADGRLTYALVQLARSRDEGIGALERVRGQLVSEVLNIQFGGELPTYVDTRTQLEKDLRKAEWVSFISLALLLVWVFGSVVAALLPLIIGGVTVVLSLSLLKLASQFTDITVYTANVVSMLGLGLSIDYSLFIISRYREEFDRCHSLKECLCSTLFTAGRTVAYSGLTVAASLLCLLLLPQHFFQNMGLAGAISVGVAMLASILILPSLLMLLGRRINRFALPWLLRRAARREAGTGWYVFSHFVMRHARLMLLGTLILLLILGLPVYHLQVGLADHRSLPPGAESRQVLETLQANFQTADLDPVVIVLRARGQVTEAGAIAGLHQLSQHVSTMPGVTAVAGLTSLDPTMSAADYQLLYEFPDQFPAAAEALKVFAHGDHVRMYVNYAGGSPQSDEVRRLVRELRTLAPPAGFEEMHVGGVPAFHLDYLDSLREWVPWTVAAIVAVIFVLLFLMLGSLLVPFKVVLTNILSLSATYGGLVWIFQDGHLAGLLGFTPAPLDGTVLVLIFASAFGLSIDYEVFLLSRVKEMCDATGDNLTSVATGIQRSGPIITNAALLIGIVLGAFALGDVAFMKQIGLGLLLAVIMDATIVRMLLVPATLRLLGRKNWWAPRPLLLVYERFNLGETGPHPRWTSMTGEEKV